MPLCNFHNLQKIKSACACLCLIAAGLSASGRIGEKTSDFETRLLSKSDGAYVYSSKEDKFRESMELPYKYIFLLMPRGVQNEFYFKRSDSQLTTNSDTITQDDLYGWELHACSYKDKLALEFYRRHGDAITFEELEALMNLQAKARNPNVYWVRETFVPVRDRWDLKFQYGKISRRTLNEKGEDIQKDTKAKLSEILPVNPDRFIYVEIPESVKSATNYNQSIPFLIMEDEQRKAYEAYRAYVAKTTASSAAKTARKKPQSSASKSQSNVSTAKSARINAFNGANSSLFSDAFMDIAKNSKGDSNNLSLFKYWLNDVKVGGKPIVRYDKEVRITTSIPQQPDTAFGFDYILSDGSVRAKLYRNGIMFISSDFDKLIRSYMESLYDIQADKRKEEALESVSKF